MPLALATALLAAGCADPSAASPAPGDGPQNPLIGVTPTSSGLTIAGHVEQRLVAASYVYLAIREPDGSSRWVVVMGEAPPLGAAITAHSMGQRADFHSSRLQRTFAELHFATLKDPRPDHAAHSDRELPDVKP